MDLYTKIDVMKKVMKHKRRLGSTVTDWEYKGMKVGVSASPENMTEKDVTRLCKILNFNPEDEAHFSTITRVKGKGRYYKRMPDPKRFCICGCGQNVSPNARFAPGHDAKLKRQLRLLIAAGDKSANRMAFELGWMDICKEPPTVNT